MNVVRAPRFTAWCAQLFCQIFDPKSPKKLCIVQNLLHFARTSFEELRLFRQEVTDKKYFFWFSLLLSDYFSLSLSSSVGHLCSHVSWLLVTIFPTVRRIWLPVFTHFLKKRTSWVDVSVFETFGGEQVLLVVWVSPQSLAAVVVVWERVTTGLWTMLRIMKRLTIDASVPQKKMRREAVTTPDPSSLPVFRKLEFARFQDWKLWKFTQNPLKNINRAVN